MKQKICRLVVGSMLVLALFMGSSPALAHENEGREHSHNDFAEQRREDRQETRAAAKARMHGKLDEARKKVCEKRSERIVSIMKKASEMGQRHLNVFTKISERVQAFYAEKKLNAANYDALKTAADAKKTAAETAITDVKNTVTFDCNGENPSGTAEQFRAKIQAMHTALKEYRTAVKNLLVEVKTAAKATVGEAQ